MTDARSVAWTIVDRRDNRPVTIAAFFTREQAERQITQWQDRHDRGGRKDITREKLLNMQPKLISDALPWGGPSPTSIDKFRY